MGAINHQTTMRGLWTLFYYHDIILNEAFLVRLDTDMSRKVFIFNFWRRHVQESPSCQPPKLARHVAMQRHRLKAWSGKARIYGRYNVIV
jgi:hypothetical protein